MKGFVLGFALKQGQNYGNWIFQPFSTIFPKYFHAMEEVLFFQFWTCLALFQHEHATCHSAFPPGSKRPCVNMTLSPYLPYLHKA